MNDEESIYYILLFFCILWMIVSLIFWKDYVVLYFLNMIINPLGVLLIILVIVNNKYRNFFKFLVSCYFFTYGFIFLFYDISNYIKSYSKIDSFYFFSDITMVTIPFKVYSNEIKKYFKIN
jgi:hypothetical protein